MKTGGLQRWRACHYHSHYGDAGRRFEWGTLSDLTGILPLAFVYTISFLMIGTNRANHHLPLMMTALWIIPDPRLKKIYRESMKSREAASYEKAI
jgi:hypothetical protein